MPSTTIYLDIEQLKICIFYYWLFENRYRMPSTFPVTRLKMYYVMRMSTGHTHISLTTL